MTSKGAFYLDHQNSVSVDMMKSAHYPLRLMDDPQLEAQVTLATAMVPILNIGRATELPILGTEKGVLDDLAWPADWWLNC